MQFTKGEEQVTVVPSLRHHRTTTCTSYLMSQATGIQENSYGWRLVLDKFMFTLTNGFRNLDGRYLQQFFVGIERYTHAQVMWKRMRPKRQLDGGQRGNERSVGRGSSALHSQSLLCERGLLSDAFVLMTAKFRHNVQERPDPELSCAGILEDKKQDNRYASISVPCSLLYTLPKAYTQNAWLNDAVIKTDVLNFVANEKAFYLSRGGETCILTTDSCCCTAEPNTTL